MVYNVIPEKEPCPRCSRLAVEGVAKVIFESMFPYREGWGKETDEWLMNNYRSTARAVIAYVKGKEG